MKKLEEREIYRHGDVDIIPVEKPEIISSQKKESHILAYGEVTGHHHELAGAVSVMQGFNGRKYIEVTRQSKLSHQEHHALSIEPGIYEILIEQEKDYFEGEIRRVQD